MRRSRICLVLFYFKNKEQTFYINIFVFFVLYKLICVMLLCYFEGPIIYKYPLFNGSLHFHRKYQFCLYYVIQILFICSLSICKWYYSHVILLNFFVLMKYCYDFWFLWKWKINLNWIELNITYELIFGSCRNRTDTDTTGLPIWTSQI